MHLQFTVETGYICNLQLKQDTFVTISILGTKPTRGWISEFLQWNYKPLGRISELLQRNYKPPGRISELLQRNYKPPERISELLQEL